MDGEVEYSICLYLDADWSVCLLDTVTQDATIEKNCSMKRNLRIHEQGENSMACNFFSSSKGKT